MKKKIRLTESELIKLVKQIVEDSQSTKPDCWINCMPTYGASGPRIDSQYACCRTRNPKSPACQQYILKYRKKDSSCKTFQFAD